MEQSRREFVDRLMLSTVSGAVALGALPSALTAAEPDALPPGLGDPLGVGQGAQASWDTGWGSRMTGRLKAVFDVPEIENGLPVWRASIWTAQYEAVLQVPAREMSTALVLRHNAIVLAMQQEYWDRYGLGTAFGARNPLTRQPSNRNVAMLGAADGVGAPYADFALDKFMGRGGITLACDLALRVLIAPLVQATDKVSADEAYAIARRGLIPGIILQPSGMFAVIRAQEAGAFYFRAG